MSVLKFKENGSWKSIPTIKGESGVYIGTTEPTDVDMNVWIDTDAENEVLQFDSLSNRPKYNSIEMTKDTNIPKVPIDVSELTDDSNGYQGKIFSILGDSISTYQGWIPTADGHNEEHSSYYGNNPYDSTQYLNIGGVENTWWHQVIEALGGQYGIIDSWTGTYLFNETEGSTDKVSLVAPVRISNLESAGTPDVILYYGGTNDMLHKDLSKIGTFDNTDSYDESKVYFTSFVESFTVGLKRLIRAYPKALVVVILPYVTETYGRSSTNFMTVANNFTTQMEQACKFYGVPTINLQECGINLASYSDYLFNEGSTGQIHPNQDGMKLIADYVIKQLKNIRTLPQGTTETYSITNNITIGNYELAKNTEKGRIKKVLKNGVYTATLSDIKSNTTVTITMGGVDVTDNVYNSSTGAISISEVTGDVVISVQPTLADNYQRYDYIESHGGAYITASISTDRNSDFYCKFKINDTNGQGGVFHAYSDNSSWDCDGFCGGYGENSWIVDYTYYNSYTDGHKRWTSDTNTHILNYTHYTSGSTIYSDIYLDNNTMPWHQEAGAVSYSTLTLFKNNYRVGSAAKDLRMYYFIVKKSDGTTYCFIPVKDTSSNTIGMLDFINNTFYTTSTGTFTTGNEI